MNYMCIDTCRTCAAVYSIAGEVVEGLKILCALLYSSCFLSVDPVEQETIPAVQESW